MWRGLITSDVTWLIVGNIAMCRVSLQALTFFFSKLLTKIEKLFIFLKLIENLQWAG